MHVTARPVYMRFQMSLHRTGGLGWSKDDQMSKMPLLGIKVMGS